MTLQDGFPPFYVSRTTPVFYNISQAYLVYSVCALFVGLLLVLPGVRGIERIFFMIRWSLSIFVGASIIICINGLGWHVSVVETYLPSLEFTQNLSRYKIGLHVGLDSFNITMKGLDQMESVTINYDEKFDFAGIDDKLDHALKRGLPSTITNIADYFAMHRVSTMWLWGRRYWVAGHYATYMLWTAFGSWIVGNVLLSTFIKYGGLSRILIGLLMLGANASFSFVNTFCCKLEIRLGQKETAVLRPVFGWSFWLCMAVGILSFVNGLIILSSNSLCSNLIHRFFGLEAVGEIPELEAVKDEDRMGNCSSSSDIEQVNLAFDETDDQCSEDGLDRRESCKKMEFVEMKPSDNFLGVDEHEKMVGEKVEYEQNGLQTTEKKDNVANTDI